MIWWHALAGGCCAWICAQCCYKAWAMRQPMPDFGGQVEAISTMGEWRQLLGRAKREGALVLVDCYARWCGPCRRAAPVFANLSERYVDVIFAKVDVDTAPEVAAHLKIEAMPTFVLLRDGEVFYKFQGFSESALLDMLAKSGAQPSDCALGGDEQEVSECSRLV